MKTMKNFTMIIAMAAVTMFIVSCGGSKAVAPTQGAVEIDVPCQNYFSDAQFFRGVGDGKSQDMNTARLKAHTNASAELAAGVQQHIGRVVENYRKEIDVAQQQQFGQTFQAKIRTTVDQIVSNTAVACTKTLREKDGSYSVYMALEVNKDEVLSQINKAAIADKEIQLMFDSERFNQTYNEELERYANQRK
ncbi:MAG: hypothetical protein LBT61_01750 [Prevotellaceae bacterium]|jgi:hypothetical protein|nr:hypothetical protein [Prevotellaceae bacterium]